MTDYRKQILEVLPDASVPSMKPVIAERLLSIVQAAIKEADEKWVDAMGWTDLVHSGDYTEADRKNYVKLLVDSVTYNNVDLEAVSTAVTFMAEQAYAEGERAALEPAIKRVTGEWLSQFEVAREAIRALPVEAVAATCICSDFGVTLKGCRVHGAPSEAGDK